MQQQQAELNFEQAMEQLEDIVRKLEHGDVPLEQAIELFQSGMELAALCGGKLDAVEQRIDMLVEEDGTLRKKLFEQGDGKGEQE